MFSIFILTLKMWFSSCSDCQTSMRFPRWRSCHYPWSPCVSQLDLGPVKNIFSSSELPDEEQLFLEIFRGWTDSIEKPGVSVGISNSDQKWMPLIMCSDIIHPGFPQEVEPIGPRTSPSKFSPKKKNHKESNKLLEKSKGALTSLPQWREDPYVRGGTVHHITYQLHPIKYKIVRDT